MKKPFLIILILAWASVAWGADWYVSTVSGVESNAGTSSGSPLSRVYHAMELASDGDTIYVYAPVSNPFRERLDIAKALTISGLNNSPAYFSGGTIISHGYAKGEYFENSGLEAWIDTTTTGANTLSVWTTSGTRDRAAVSESGVYSIDLAGSAYIERSMGLPYNKTFTIAVRNKWVASNGRPNITVRANKSGATPANRYWNNTTLAWQDADPTTDNQPTTGSATWVTNGTTFTTNPGMSNGDSGVLYYITIKNASSGRLYVDSVSLTDSGEPNYTWVQHDGNTWKLNGRINQTGIIFYQLASESYDPAKLTKIKSDPTDIDSVAACVAASNSLFYDNSGTDKILYVNFGGLDPTTLYIESARVIVYGSGSIGHISLNNNSAVFNYIYGVNGFAGIHALKNGTLNYCQGMYSYQGLVASDNSTASFNNCVATGNNENGFTADGTSGKTSTKPTFTSCRAISNGDDGFQSIFGASFVAKKSVSSLNGPGDKAANIGFINEGSGSGMELYSCSASKNYNAGILADYSTGGTVIIKNTASGGNVTSGNVGEKDITVVGTPDSSNCAYNMVQTANSGSGSGLFPGGSDGNLVSNPKLTSSGKLRIGSPAKSAGVEIAGVNDTGTDIWGNSSFRTNIGAYWGSGVIPGVLDIGNGKKGGVFRIGR